MAKHGLIGEFDGDCETWKSEPEITVGHWIISDHFWHLSDQKSVF